MSQTIASANTEGLDLSDIGSGIQALGDTVLQYPGLPSSARAAASMLKSVGTQWRL